MEDVEVALAALELANYRAERAQEELARAVISARQAGASWADVGRATGVARQSAHQKWGRASRGACGRRGCKCSDHGASECKCGHR